MKIFVPGFAPVLVDEPEVVAEVVSAPAIEQSVSVEEAIRLAQARSSRVIEHTRNPPLNGSPLVVNDPDAIVPTPLFFQGTEIVFDSPKVSPVELTEQELAVLDAALTK